MGSKQELADLLKEEDKNEFVTRLPLYSSRMTGYKWICSECWDKAYRYYIIINKLNNNDRPSDK
jgi:thymidine kinase